jgi:hypothetical protein
MLITTKAATRKPAQARSRAAIIAPYPGGLDEGDLLQERRGRDCDQQENADEPEHAAPERLQQGGTGDREYDLCHLGRAAVAALGTESAVARSLRARAAGRKRGAYTR